MSNYSFSGNQIRNATFLVSLGLILAFLFLLSERIQLIPRVNHDSGGVEQNVIYGIQRILDGRTLYSDPSEPPYAIIQYAPAYYHIAATIGTLTRVKAERPLGVYRLSRTLSLVFNLLLIGVVIYFCLVLIGMHPIYAISVGILLFIFLRITDFSRPDSLYHLLLFLSLFTFYNGIKKRKDHFLYLGFALAATAIFAKQSAIFLPILLFAWLALFQFSIKRLALGAFVYGVVFTTMLLLFSQPDLDTFWLNVFGGIDNGVSGDWFYRRIIKLYGRELAPMAAIFFTAGIVLVRRGNFKEDLFLFWSLIWTFIFGIGTAFKWGSMPSYFTPFLGIGFIILAQLASSSSRLKMRWPQYLFIFFCLFSLAAEFPVKMEMTDKPDESHIHKMASEIANWIRSEDELNEDQYVMVLLDDGTLLDRSFINNELLGKALFPQKDIVSCCAYPGGVFDYSRYKDKGNHGLIKYLIRYSWSDLNTYLDVKLTNFKEVQKIGRYSILEYTDPEAAGN